MSFRLGHTRAPTDGGPLLDDIDLTPYPPDSPKSPDSPDSSSVSLASPRSDKVKALLRRPPGPTDLPPRRVTLILILLYIATVLYGIDSTVVATLATPIASGFSQQHRAAWLNSSYLLSVACCTPLYGRLSDILGRRVAIVLGLALFALGSLLCGMSRSMGMLIFARLIQGAGGGGSGLLGSIITSDVVSLRTRGLLNGVGSVCWATGAGLGGVYGGVVADALGWRWAFLLQVPALSIIMIGLAFSVNYVVPGQNGSLRALSQRLDWMGSALLIVGIGAFVFSIAFKTNEDMAWSHPLVFGTMILSILAMVGFGFVESYWAPEPVIELALLKDPSRLALALATGLQQAATISLGLFFPMLLQVVRGNSAALAGLHLIPNTVASACGGVSSGFYIRSTGKYHRLLLILGTLQFLPCFFLSTFTSHTWEFLTWIILTPQRFGSSGFSGTVTIALLATVTRLEVAQVTSIRFLFVSCGQVLGMAISSAVQQSILAAELAERISGDDAAAVITEVRRNATAILALSPEMRLASIGAYTTSLHAVYLANGVLALAALLFVFRVKEYSLQETAPQAENEYKLAAENDDEDEDEEAS